MKKTALISLFFLFMLSSLAAMPQKESADPSLWPEEEVTVICPWAVGGVADIVNRSLAPHLEKELGVPVIASNELGAGGNVALTNYLHSDDMYELILGGEGGFAISPYVEDPGVIRFTYDDFEPVINLYSSIMVLAANSKTGIDDLSGLIEYGRNNRITVAVNGVSGAEAFLVRALFDEIELEYDLINYNGANLAVRAAAKGETVLSVSHQSQAASAVEDSSLTPILVFDGKRSDSHPFESVPALSELGYDTYYPNTCALFVRKGTDAEIIGKLQKAYLSALSEEDVKALYETLMIEMDPMVGHDYDAHISNVSKIVKGALDEEG